MCDESATESQFDSADDTPSGFASRMQAIQLSPRFTAFDLCCGSNTWRRLRIINEPKQEASWAALRQICAEILEPIADRFGKPVVTYGFASQALMKHVPGNITPTTDQHVSCELNRKGLPVCKRLGASVDLRVPGVNSLDVARFVMDKLPFDRLYYYDSKRPFHVSIGPDRKGDAVRMVVLPSGRLIPQRIRAL